MLIVDWLILRIFFTGNIGKENFYKSANHPVHILDRDGILSPSAFIPFCAFGDDMKTMGRVVKGFHDPVCDSFKAKIRNDQLCYEVDLENYRNKHKIKEQLKSGLVMMLDYNLERQSETYNPNKVPNFGTEENENDAKIYLNTISKFNLN